MADDRLRRDDEETSEHDVSAFPAATPSWQPPGATPDASPRTGQWQPPAATPWQPPASPAPPGWDPNQGWGQGQGGPQGHSQGGPQGQAGWAAPPAWGQQPAYRTGPAPYGSAGRAVAAAIMLLVYGIPALVFGGLVTLVALSAGNAFTDEMRRELQAQGLDFDLDALLRFILIFFALMFILGMVHVAAAIGVLAHKGWGRVLGIVVAILGLLFGGLLLVSANAVGDPSSLIFAGLVLAGYALVLFGLATGGVHFRRIEPGRW